MYSHTHTQAERDTLRRIGAQSMGERNAKPLSKSVDGRVGGAHKH